MQKKYISTIGAKNYLTRENFSKKNNIELNFFEYFDKEYNQLHGKFTSNLSVIDLLFNEGQKSKEILKKNFFYKQKFMKRRLLIIPARSGSKRIKNKNIRLFQKKPIIYFPLKVAKKANCLIKYMFQQTQRKLKS